MAKRGRTKSKLIPMTVANDSALWRFASLEDALGSSIDLIARLIRAGEEQLEAGEAETEVVEPVTLARGA